MSFATIVVAAANSAGVGLALAGVFANRRRAERVSAERLDRALRDLQATEITIFGFLRDMLFLLLDQPQREDWVRLLEEISRWRDELRRRLNS